MSAGRIDKAVKVLGEAETDLLDELKYDMHPEVVKWRKRLDKEARIAWLEYMQNTEWPKLDDRIKTEFKTEWEIQKQLEWAELKERIRTKSGRAARDSASDGGCAKWCDTTSLMPQWCKCCKCCSSIGRDTGCKLLWLASFVLTVLFGIYAVTNPRLRAVPIVPGS